MPILKDNETDPETRIRKFDLLGGLYAFHEETGKLEHPCGFLTSWFRQDGESYVPSEWAADMSPQVQVLILTKLNDV